MTEPVSCHFASQGLRLHYLDWGNPAAPTLVLLHGGCDHAHSWDQVARELRADWHVIAPDLRGHGDSAWSPDGAYDMHDYLLDFAALVATLGSVPVTIIAHSLGGAVVTRFAAIYSERVRRLVTIEGMGRPPAQTHELETQPMPDLWRRWIDLRAATHVRRPRVYPDIAAAQARLRAANPVLNEEQVHHLVSHGVRARADGGWSWKYDNRVRAATPLVESAAQMAAIWGAIACPVLLCHGGRSFASDPAADGRLAHYRDARMAYFDTAGHWLHHEETDHFLAVVRAFCVER